MDENKPQQVSAIHHGTASELSPETLAKLASREAEIRASGVIDVFEQSLKGVPKDWKFGVKNAEFYKDAMDTTFDLIGGIPKLMQWAHQNPSDYYKLWTRLMPEVQKASAAATTVIINNAVPMSPLDSGQYGEVTEIESDDDE